MRVQVEASVLAQAIKFLAVARHPKTSTHTLNHLLITSDGSHLRLVATDGVCWAEYRIPVAAEPSQLVTFRHLLGSLATELSEPLTLSWDGAGRLRCSFTNGEYYLPAMDSSDFPLPPVGEQGVEVEIKGLGELVRKVAFAAATNPHEGLFHGIHLNSNGSVLEVVATDTYRMAIARTPLPDGTPPFKTTIPAPTLKSLAPYISDSEVTVRVGGSFVTFSSYPWQVTITAYSGSFPDYHRIIPTNLPYQLQVDSLQLQKVLRRTASFTTASKIYVTSPPRLIFHLDHHPLVILYHSAEGLEIATEPLSGRWLTDPAGFYIAIQHRFLIEFLSTVKAGDITIGVSDPTKAILLQPPDPTWLYVVMPMVLPAPYELSAKPQRQPTGQND